MIKTESKQMKSFTIQLLLILALTSLSFPVSAQHERCSAVLAARQFIAEAEDEVFLEAVATMADEKTLKSSAESLKIGLPEIIDADGEGWRKAKKRVRTGSSRFTSKAHARSFLFEGPALGAVEAWTKCMQQSQATNFFAYIPYAASRDEVAVSLYWSRGAGDPTPLELQKPIDGNSQLNTGEYTTTRKRPTNAEGPREIVFNGKYPVGVGGQYRSVSAVIVLLPPPEETAARQARMREIDWSYSVRRNRDGNHTFQCHADGSDVGSVIDCRTYGTCSNQAGNELACAGSFYHEALSRASNGRELPRIEWSYQTIRVRGHNHTFKCFANGKEVGALIDCRTFGTCSNKLGNTLMCAGQNYLEAIGAVLSEGEG